MTSNYQITRHAEEPVGKVKTREKRYNFEPIFKAITEAEDREWIRVDGLTINEVMAFRTQALAQTYRRWKNKVQLEMKSRCVDEVSYTIYIQKLMLDRD